MQRIVFASIILLFAISAQAVDCEKQVRADMSLAIQALMNGAPPEDVARALREQAAMNETSPEPAMAFLTAAASKNTEAGKRAFMTMVRDCHATVAKRLTDELK